MHSLEKLWAEVEADFERWGFYAEGGAGDPVRQGGVFRTNCIDCLDRTNVVQVRLRLHVVVCVCLVLMARLLRRTHHASSQQEVPAASIGAPVLCPVAN